MKILITGASGFLGGHLVDLLLEKGYDIHVLVRKSSDLSHLHRSRKEIVFRFGNIENPVCCALATTRIDVVIHAAARASEVGKYASFENTNIRGTKLLLNAARKNGVSKFIYISSPSVVAEFKNQIHINENYPYPKNPLNFYCQSKAIAEQYVISQHGKGICTTSIRPRGIWGIRDRYGFIPRLLKKIQLGKLQNLSGGRPVQANLCHVYNVSHACYLATLSDKVGGNIYFITDDHTIEVWGFLEQLASIFDLPPITKKANPQFMNTVASVFEKVWKIPYLRNNQAMPLSKYTLGLLTKDHTYNINKAKKDLGYQPVIDKNTALVDLQEWVKKIGGVQEFTKHV